MDQDKQETRANARSGGGARKGTAARSPVADGPVARAETGGEGGKGSSAKGAGSGAGKGGSARGGRSKQPDLQKDLRDFAVARPQGWGHDDWLNFLESLQSRGHNVNDREAIGIALEKERLDIALGSIKGVGRQRRQALIDRYGTLWNLRNADADEIASVAGMPRNLAAQVKSGLS